MKSNTLTYFSKIDGLRCVAIVFVLVEHFITWGFHAFSFGFYGVDLFFVISGFLITGILLKTKKTYGKDYRNFLIRRVLRIFPIYYLTILVLIWDPIVDRNLLYLLTYTFNYSPYLLFQPPVGHLWSLCVEEQFYLFWPLVILAVRRKKLLSLFIICMIISIGYIQAAFDIIPITYNKISLPARMGSLGFGALIAWMYNYKYVPLKIINNYFTEILFLGVMVFILTTQNPIGFYIAGICSAYFILKAATVGFKIKPIDRFLQSKAAIFVGTISYGIYVYHAPIGYYLDIFVLDKIWAQINWNNKVKLVSKLQYNKWLFKFPVYSLISVGVAWASFSFIEKPILTLKNKFQY